jgi:hypothetical protein
MPKILAPSVNAILEIRRGSGADAEQMRRRCQTTQACAGKTNSGKSAVAAATILDAEHLVRPAFRIVFARVAQAAFKFTVAQVKSDNQDISACVTLRNFSERQIPKDCKVYLSLARTL